jgi:hypothetical protein
MSNRATISLISQPSSRLSITKGQALDPALKQVNQDLVVKEGFMYKKGDLLKMYNNQYYFYLERRDESAGIGPLLKYGKKGKIISRCLDLGF